jgi:hypothetical protein
VQLGDLVLAIGHPFGVGQTVTRGIVSATDRGGMGIEDYAARQFGWALVDITGQLIGINTFNSLVLGRATLLFDPARCHILLSSPSRASPGILGPVKFSLPLACGLGNLSPLAHWLPLDARRRPYPQAP